MTVAAAGGSIDRSRRGTEAVLAGFALLVVVAAYAVVGLATGGQVPAELLGYAAALVALVAAAHLAVRRLAPFADPVILPIATLLNGIGLVVIHRIDLAYARDARALGRSVPHAYAPTQLVWTAVGIGLFVAVLAVVRDHRVLPRYTYISMVVGLALLGLPSLLPASISEVNGARLWVRVQGFSIQPAEFAKLLLLIFTASYLVRTRDALTLAGRRLLGMTFPRARDVGPVVLAWVVSLGVLVRERDLGTSLLFFGVFVALIYVATERPAWLAVGALLFVGGSWLAYTQFGHVQRRVELWLHPFADPHGAGYQLVQGLYGLATGGLLGTGLGQGRPQLVPYARTDFIVTAYGEELGLTGLAALLLCYLVLIQRGLRIGVSLRDEFGSLLAGGLAITLALQVFVVVGGVTRLIPLTGLTLPFLSYGGSSLVANWGLVALLLRLSDSARRPVALAGTRPVVAGFDAPTQVIRL